MLSSFSVPSRIWGFVKANPSDREIAAGVVLALFFGFVPLNEGMAFLLAILFFLVRVNRFSTIVFLPLFKLVYLAGGRVLAERVGAFLLIDAGWLAPLWRWLTSLPVVALLDINYTLIIGGVAVAALLSLPVYLGAKRLGSSIRSLTGRYLGGLGMAGAAPSAVPRRKKKRFNAAGVVAIVLALAVFHYGCGLFAGPFLKTALVGLLNTRAGMRVSVDDLRIWPLTLSVSLDGLKLFDPGEPAARIAKLDHVSVRLSPLGLLAGRLVVASLGIRGAEIDIEGRPDGTFSVQHLAAPAAASATAPAAASVKPVLDRAWQGRDWIGKGFELARKKFSPAASADRAAKRADARRAAKTVSAADFGKRVDFRPATDRYLFQIRRLAARDAFVRIHMDGDAVTVDRATITLGALAVDPVNGLALGRFRLAGGLAKNDKVIGRIDLAYARSPGGGGEEVLYDINLTDVDLVPVKFLYGKTLPLTVEAGRLTLRSKTHIRSGALDSRNGIVATGQRVSPRGDAKMLFNVIPADILVEAINAADPFRLDFTVGGTVEKPELKGLEESLMKLVRPYLEQLKDRVIAQGAAAAQKAIGKNLGKWLGKDAPGDGDTKGDVDSAVKALGSFFSKESDGN